MEGQSFMNYALSILLNYLLLFIECISLITFSESFFQRKLSGYKAVFALIVLVSLTFICLAISDHITVLKLPMIICVGSLWLTIVYRVSIIKCIGIDLLFTSLISAADSIITIESALVANIDIQKLYQDPYGYYLLCFFAKILELLIITAIRFLIKQKLYLIYTPWQQWLKIFILPFSSLIIAIFLWRLYWIFPFAAGSILLCVIALLIVNIFAIYALNYLDQQQQLLQDNLLLQKNLKYQNEVVGAWANAYKDQRKMTHDFQNQLSVIYGLAEHESSSIELLTYIRTVLKNSTSNSLVVKTGRMIADVLISQKYHTAQEKEIRFSLQLGDLTYFGLEDEYLVVVLSNLIDNAINACDKIDKNKRREITLAMKVEQGSSFLYIENTTAVPVKILDNQVVVPKSQNSEHGYGLKNVARILNGHDAIFSIDYNDDSGVFCFSTQIPTTL